MPIPLACPSQLTYQVPSALNNVLLLKAAVSLVPTAGTSADVWYVSQGDESLGLQFELSVQVDSDGFKTVMYIDKVHS